VNRPRAFRFHGFAVSFRGFAVSFSDIYRYLVL